MILKIDTTKREEIKISLVGENGKENKIAARQKLGSQALLPRIIKILEKNKKKIGHIRSIKVNRGPGSFTGTRVGVAVANALGFALDIPVNNKKGKIVTPIYEKSKFD